VAGLGRLAASLVLALAAAPLTDGTLRPQIDRLVAAVSAARRLPFHGTLPVRALGRDEIAHATALAVGEGMDNAAARTEDEILKRLGLVPTGSTAGDLAARTYALAAPPIARYDPTTGTLLVPNFLPLESQRTEIAHEIAHAITDQHFGLRRFLRIAPGGEPRLDGDETRARLAIVEGDALLAGLELADPRESFLGMHALTVLGGRLRNAPTSAPGWFEALGELTHVDGLLFVAGVRAHRSFDAVDLLWRDPPASTEQILHPEKYEACEAPIAVEAAALPALPGFGRPSGSDVLGEWAIRTWLAAALPPEIADRAAAGWGGDRAGIYTTEPTATPPGAGTRAPADAGVAGSADAGAAKPVRAPLAWLTVWDGPAEADDFARAAVQRLARLAHADAPDDDGGRTIFRTPAGAFALARREDAVALLVGAPEPVGPALDAMLDAVRPRPSRRAAPRPRRAAQPGCPRRDRAAAPG
jgi:hypothetical protein